MNQKEIVSTQHALVRIIYSCWLILLNRPKSTSKVSDIQEEHAKNYRRANAKEFMNKWYPYSGFRYYHYKRLADPPLQTVEAGQGILTYTLEA